MDDANLQAWGLTEGVACMGRTFSEFKTSLHCGRAASAGIATKASKMAMFHHICSAKEEGG